jgi:hypothetical protein
MATTTTPTKPSAASAKPTGKIAIIWHPERDSKVAKPPIQTKSHRPFVFEWIDQADVAKNRQLREDMDILKSQMISPMPFKTAGVVRLEAGLNWVELPKWEAAIFESARRLEAEDYCSDEDQLQRLIRENAIEVMPRANDAQATGKIADYPPASQIRIIESIDDAGTLIKMIDESLAPSARERLVARIAQLDGRF